jgi:hypothetical protein
MKKILLPILLLFLSCSKEEQTPPPPTNYTVSITLNPTDGGTVSPSGGQFEEGTTVSFTVTPTDNYIFKNWSGSDTSSNNPLLLTINSNKTLTVNFEKKDTDGDGVPDDLDQCPDTPSGEEVNETGCSDSQVDTDGDGVVDIIDLDNESRPGVPVDENGVMLNPIYLDENGVTIKSHEWGEVGDVGEINGVEYEIINEETLRYLVGNGMDYSKVCVTKISNMRDLFYEKPVKEGYIVSWDVSNVTMMGDMFRSSNFNEDIGHWNVSRVNDMNGMFRGSTFNQPIGEWEVGNVNNMSQMFQGSKFNQPIGDWNVGNVTNMMLMFSGTSFNQDIGNWNVSNVTMMGDMFRSSTFNQDISSWNVINVTNMGGMLRFTPFNQDLSGWNVQKVNWCRNFSSYGYWTLPKPVFRNCRP